MPKGWAEKGKSGAKPALSRNCEDSGQWTVDSG